MRSALSDQPDGASPKRSVPWLEGDGWVNWSGLATLFDEFGRTLAESLTGILTGLGGLGAELETGDRLIRDTNTGVPRRGSRG